MTQLFDDDAGSYDATISHVVHRYDLLHHALLTAARDHLLAHQGSVVLDIGAGTGTATLGLLNAHDTCRVVAIDSSQSMLQQLHQRIPQTFAPRCFATHADIRDHASAPGSLPHLIPTDWSTTRFSLVMSSFVLHHFPRAIKTELYTRIAEALHDGGLFLNLDLFTFSSPLLAQRALEADLAWIRRSFASAAEEASRSNSKEADQLRSLAQEWVRHYQNDNLTAPLEEEQRDLLLNAGFAEVEMPVRMGQSGLLWARL